MMMMMMRRSFFPRSAWCCSEVMALLERFYDPSSGVVQAVWLQNRWEVDFGEVSTGVVDLHGLKNVA